MNAVVKRFVQLGFLILLQAVALFVGAGRLNWWAGWAYMGIYVGFIGINALLILPHGTELVAERGRVVENTRGWDRVLMLLLALFGPGMLVVGGLDERLGWPPIMAPLVQWAGGIAMCLGYGLFSWGMAENQFFSSMVRIQGERGHAVCSTGPYRFVRHPGYIGVIGYSLAAPLLLGSAWAFIPAVLTAGVIVARTVLEDKTLHKELEGYTEYAQKVRYRLIPGIW